MKFAIFADPHLGYSSLGPTQLNGVPTHTMDTLACMDEFCQFAANDREVRELFILGDVFDRKNPDSRVENLFAGFLGKWMGHFSNVWIIEGNHDRYRDVSALAVYSGLTSRLDFNLHIVSQPQRHPNYPGLLMIPWPDPDKAITDWTIGKHISNMDFTDVNLVMGHLPVVVGHAGRVFADAVPSGVFGGARVLLGHYHHAIRSDRVEYVGSINRCDMSEVEEKHGVILTVEKDDIEYFCAPSVTKIFRMETSANLWASDIDRHAAKIEGAVVDLKIVRQETDTIVVKDIEQYLYDMAGARYVRDISEQVLFQRAETVGGDEFDVSPEIALREFIGAAVLEEDIRAEAIEIGLQIMAEAGGSR